MTLLWVDALLLDYDGQFALVWGFVLEVFALFFVLLEGDKVAAYDAVESCDCCGAHAVGWPRLKARDEVFELWSSFARRRVVWRCES